MSSWGTPALLAVFVAAAAATWVAGVYLSRATDALDLRWGMGETFGGMLLLAIAGTLPEAAITVTAALSHQIGLAAGNLLGGIAIQTAVLVVCDFFVTEKKPLSYLVGSLIPVLEASLVIAMTAVAMLGALLPPTTLVAGMSPASILIVVLWLGGMAVLNSVRNSPKWTVVMPGSKPGRHHRRVPHRTYVHPYAHASTGRVVAVFLFASVVTLVAGVGLTVSGSAIATNIGMNGILFGATVLALASALPELSTGIAAVRIGDNQLAMGDIFGGNAFQLTLFLAADLLAGTAVLAQAGATNSWLAGLGILVTIVYAASVVVRPERNYFRLGADSLVVLCMLVVGFAGLALIAR
jgi:cation:H+ antiporter